MRLKITILDLNLRGLIEIRPYAFQCRYIRFVFRFHTVSLSL
jgi:hypothetical protein